MKIKILVVATACLSTSVFAGGYRVALQGQNALGMGHTGVAMTDSAEVVFFNPAGMSSLNTDSSFSSGITLINSKTQYQNTQTNVSAETNNDIGTPIYLYYTKKFDQKLSYGLGIYTPYGNAVKWPKDWVGSHLVNNISLKTVFVQPTISYKVNDMISIGGGPIYINGQVELNRNLNADLADENGVRSNVTVKATGITAWGYSVGLLIRPIKPLTIGVNYRSRSDLNAKNANADYENIKPVLANQFTDTTFNSTLVLPAELTVGFAYDMSPSTTVAVDINRTFWSAYQSLDLTFANGLISYGPRNYNDANVYRVGVQHKLNDTLTLRAGAYFDDTPIDDGYHAPETPRNDSTGLTLGASYSVTKRLDIDVSFLYLMFDEFNGSYDYVGRTNQSSSTDASFGGDYLSSVTTYGLGVSYKY